MENLLIRRPLSVLFVKMVGIFLFDSRPYLKELSVIHMLLK
jgi:hypothetical protein